MLPTQSERRENLLDGRILTAALLSIAAAVGLKQDVPGAKFTMRSVPKKSLEKPDDEMDLKNSLEKPDDEMDLNSATKYDYLLFHC